MALVTVPEPDFGAREHALDRSAATRIDRIDDMEDLHRRSALGPDPRAARFGDNLLAIAQR
jgi:hypothetical protein